MPHLPNVLDESHNLNFENNQSIIVEPRREIRDFKAKGEVNMVLNSIASMQNIDNASPILSPDSLPCEGNDPVNSLVNYKGLLPSSCGEPIPQSPRRSARFASQKHLLDLNKRNLSAVISIKPGPKRKRNKNLDSDKIVQNSIPESLIS